jgi:Transposase DDE domain group 1
MYAIHVPANDSLERDIAKLLTRPTGQAEPQASGLIQGLSLPSGQLEDRTTSCGEGGVPRGELFPRVGFIVTNLSLPSRAILRFYNKRGTAEQWIKEGKQATHWTRLSCHRFRANEASLQLSLLAYNLGNLWRRLVLPKRIDAWSLTACNSGWSKRVGD